MDLTASFSIWLKFPESCLLGMCDLHQMVYAEIYRGIPAKESF